MFELNNLRQDSTNSLKLAGGLATQNIDGKTAMTAKGSDFQNLKRNLNSDIENPDYFGIKRD